MLTDHKGLEYFMSIKKLTFKQARWVEFLSKYNFVISYQSGKKNDKADALTRKLCDRPINNNDKRLEHRIQMLLSPERFEHAVTLQPIEELKSPTTSAVDLTEPHSTSVARGISKFSTLPEEVQNANRNDNLYTRICAYLEAPGKIAKPTVHVNSCKINNGLLMKINHLWVLEGKDKQLRLKMIKEVHDQSAMGHPGTVTDLISDLGLLITISNHNY